MSAGKVTDENFAEEIDRHAGVAVVDFWATWCGPCLFLGRIIDSIAAEYDGKAKVSKLDVDQNPVTAQRFGVRSIPTLVVFVNGKPVDRVVGVVPKAELQRRIAAHLVAA